MPSFDVYGKSAEHIEHELKYIQETIDAIRSHNPKTLGRFLYRLMPGVELTPKEKKAIADFCDSSSGRAA